MAILLYYFTLIMVMSNVCLLLCCKSMEVQPELRSAVGGGERGPAATSPITRKCGHAARRAGSTGTMPWVPINSADRPLLAPPHPSAPRCYRVRVSASVHITWSQGLCCAQTEQPTKLKTWPPRGAKFEQFDRDA